jgi:hypothetical protein
VTTLVPYIACLGLDFFDLNGILLLPALRAKQSFIDELVRCYSDHERARRTNDMMRTASCQCGQLSVTVEGEPALVSLCNCTWCQKRSGSAFALASRWNANQVKGRSGNASTYSRKGASGRNVEINFCPRCSSTVSTSLELLPDVIGIPVGCFADPGFPEPKVAVWCNTKLEWVRFPDGVLKLRDQNQPMETQ